MFIWNKTMALKKNYDHLSSYGHVNEEPIKFKLENLSVPVIASKGSSEIKPMVRLSEFIERIYKSASLAVRACNNEIEDQNFIQIKDLIHSEIAEGNKLDLSFYQKVQNIVKPNILKS